jgi:hypothetical protein
MPMSGPKCPWAGLHAHERAYMPMSGPTCPWEGLHAHERAYSCPWAGLYMPTSRPLSPWSIIYSICWWIRRNLSFPFLVGLGVAQITVLHPEKQNHHISSCIIPFFEYYCLGVLSLYKGLLLSLFCRCTVSAVLSNMKFNVLILQF